LGRPAPELVLVLDGEFARTGQVGGFSYHVAGGFYLRAEGVGEALLDKADGEMGNVDDNPAAVEALGYLDSGAAAAEWGKSWPFGSGKGPAGRVRFFGSGTNAKEDRSIGNWRYTVVAGEAKWKFRSASFLERAQ
jgi:hypothetical protein